MNINPVILSIPIYFSLIAVELLIQQFSKKKLYRLNDAITNISCGITQQLTGTFLIIFGIGIYQLIYEHLAIFNIPSNAFIVFLIIITIVNCGALFEFKNWVLSAEKIRISLITGIVFFLSFVNGWDILLLTAGLAYFLVSMIWLFNIDFNRSEVAEIQKI